MQDLSQLAQDSMWPTSQAAGNMTSSNDQAMTAPGSLPVTPLPDRQHQDDPNVSMSGPPVPVCYSGKPQARAGASPARRAAWTKTTTPDVERDGRFDASRDEQGGPGTPMDEVHPGTRLSINYGAPRISGAGSAAEH
jgi:hypothetical protein